MFKKGDNLKTTTYILLLILSYCLGLLTLQPSIAPHVFLIDWSHQRVANIASILAAIGTFAAVITALWQSHQAKLEAEKNRKATIVATKEKATIYNNILISPPDFLTFSIGITVINSGQVPIHLQGMSCFYNNINTQILITNEMLEPWSQKFPITLPAGSKVTFGLNYKFLMNIARYSIECCNGNTTNIGFSISSNLKTFESKLNQEIATRANKLIELKNHEIEKQISESTQSHKDYESKNEDNKWLDLFE